MMVDGVVTSCNLQNSVTRQLGAPQIFRFARQLLNTYTPYI